MDMANIEFTVNHSIYTVGGPRDGWSGYYDTSYFEVYDQFQYFIGSYCDDDYEGGLSDDEYNGCEYLCIQDESKFKKLEKALDHEYDPATPMFTIYVGVTMFLIMFLSRRPDDFPACLPKEFPERFRLKIVDFIDNMLASDIDNFDDPEKRKKALYHELFLFTRGARGFDDV
jgi:hypothetical protein